MKYIIVSCLIIAFCFSIPARANDYPVTVRGKVLFCDYSGGSFIKLPLAGAKVELVDSDADGSQIFDDVIGTAIVNADGTFEVSGRGGDPGDYSWSRPDIYVRFVFNYNDKVRLTDELDRTRYANTPEHDHDNFEGVLDIGTWTLDNGLGSGESSEPAVWYAVCRAWDEYVKIMGEEPQAGHCDVEYWSAIYAGTPWTSDNTIHWPIHYDSRSARHEFAHLIRHSFDGDRNHFNWDVTRFRYARYHGQCEQGCNNWSTESKEMNDGYAFNEGWAEFWANELHCPMGYSSQCEGGVAYTLKDIQDELAKTIKNPRAFMCRVLKNNPGSIHSIGEFISKMNELYGQVAYSEKVHQMTKTNIATSYVVSNLPPEAMSTYKARNINNIDAAISKITGRIPQKGRMYMIRPCKDAICDADEKLLSSSLIAAKDLLQVQKEMFQSNGSFNQEMLDQKRMNNSIDNFMNELRNSYNSRLNNIAQNVYQQTINQLQSNAQDPYVSGLIANLQSKSPAGGHGRGGGDKNTFTYSLEIPVAATKGE